MGGVQNESNGQFESKFIKFTPAPAETLSYEKLVYVPVDLPLSPKFDLSFLEEMTVHTSKTGRFSREYFYTRLLRYADFDKDSVKKQWDFDLEWSWVEDYKKPFDPLIKWLEAYLPFQKITYAVILGTMEKGVPAHRDLLEYYPCWILKNEPCFYRLNLYGRFNGQFYLSSNETGNSKIYPNLPIATSTFCINSTSVWHGVEGMEPSYWLFVSGKFDWKRHCELIHRSVEKFESSLLRYGDLIDE